jgi:predicted Zn-dependent protease with MMP-like domain
VRTRGELHGTSYERSHAVPDEVQGGEGESVRLRDDQLAAEQSGGQRRQMVGMDGRSRADMRLGRSAVEARDPVEPQPVQQVRVVAVTEEPRGVLADDVSVEVAEHGHLVVAADRREDRAHGRIGERRHQILSALRRARGPAREGILHWLDPDDLTKPTQGLLVDRGVPLGAAHDGETTATRPPCGTGGGTSRSLVTPASVPEWTRDLSGGDERGGVRRGGRRRPRPHPEELARLMSNVAVLVDEEPPPQEPDLLGLYEGVPLTERDGWWDAGSLPDRITIFKGPLTRLCDDREDLLDEIAVTVVHEVAHHFGISDERLHELGWD